MSAFHIPLVTTVGARAWNNAHDEMNQLWVEDAVRDGLPGSPHPIGFAARNRTKERRILYLVLSPNLLPYGRRVAMRPLVAAFDKTLSTHGGVTWGYHKRSVIRYMNEISDHYARNEIHFHEQLGRPRPNRGGGGTDVKRHFIHMKGRLLVILIFRSLIGWRQGLGQLPFTLAQMQRDPYWRPYYYLYVLPLMHYICTEMNDGSEMNPHELLVSVNIHRCEGEIKRRAKNGLWSQDRMIYRINRPPNDPEEIRTIDNNITKGIEYKFARLCSLVIPDFKPRWSRAHRDRVHMYLTATEWANLYRGYDLHTPMRQLPPRGPP